mgnify:CR=1 FL=1
MSLRVIVSNIFLAVWDAALKIMVIMRLALHGIKVTKWFKGREAKLVRSTSWPAEACVY